MKRLIALASLLAITAGCSDKKPEGIKVRPPNLKDLKRYTMDLQGTGALMARIDTKFGELHCELFEDKAPLTVANFVGLARGLHPWRDPNGSSVKAPFYEGLIFHRVIPGFMIQGGDPAGNGSGGPGYKFATEIAGDLSHDKPGIMSMANAGPNTNGSQFFIMDGTRTSLDGTYNIFGQCAETNVISEIAAVKTIQDGRENSRPEDPPKILKVEIYRK
jgi:peptidyl-prolyl cis-trans isomerase A (cyclophilin A)